MARRTLRLRGLLGWAEPILTAGTIVAPWLIPRKPGDRIKTHRRDAVGLAELCVPASNARPSPQSPLSISRVSAYTSPPRRDRGNRTMVRRVGSSRKCASTTSRRSDTSSPMRCSVPARHGQIVLAGRHRFDARQMRQQLVSVLQRAVRILRSSGCSLVCCGFLLGILQRKL